MIFISFYLPSTAFILCSYSHGTSSTPPSPSPSCVPPLSLTDFGIVSYSFSRIAATIEQKTPFALSSNVALLCLFPTFVFVALHFAYRYIRHPMFSYQREGPVQRGQSYTEAGGAVSAAEAVAEATAGGLLPWFFRFIVFGLSGDSFNAIAIVKAGDTVLPGALPARMRGSGRGRAFGFHGYRLLWWYWQALKRNHNVLAPFLAPYHPGRGHAHYSATLLAR